MLGEFFSSPVCGRILLVNELQEEVTCVVLCPHQASLPLLPSIPHQGPSHPVLPPASRLCPLSLQELTVWGEEGMHASRGRGPPAVQLSLPHSASSPPGL